jgi:plasmid stabilization system protein ParE
LKKLAVGFSHRAASELDRLEALIGVDNPDAAARVRKEIVAQAIRLGENPEMGWLIKNPKTRHRNVRLWPVTRYRQYLILYRVGPQIVRIVSILNAAQDWTRFFGGTPESRDI